MGTATASKARSAILDWTSAGVASTDFIVGTEINVATMLGNAYIIITMGRDTATLFSTSLPPRIDIQGSDVASGDDNWAPVASYPFAPGSSLLATTLNGAIIAGATTATLTSVTGLVADQLLYLGHTTLPANYEVVRIKSISGSVVTFVAPCAYAHDNTAKVTNGADRQAVLISLDGLLRVRVTAVCDNQGGSGQKYYVRVALAATQSISYS